MEFLFELGEEVEDVYTGFKGYIYSRIEYINGCIRYEVKPTKLKDGGTIEAEWIDEQQLKSIKKRSVKKSKTGGDRDTPKSNLSSKSF